MGQLRSPVSVERIGRPRSGFYYHTVQPGDTLSELARDFDSTQLAILEYNDLPDPETVYNGLPLRIPYGPPPLPVETPPTPLGGTRFLVSLSRQQCWVLDGDRGALPVDVQHGVWQVDYADGRVRGADDAGDGGEQRLRAGHAVLAGHL